MLVCIESCRLDELIFNSRNLGVPCVLRFHPYEPHLAVADKDHIRLVSIQFSHSVD